MWNFCCNGYDPKIKWFATSFAIMFSSCNDHLQFHYKSTYFYEMSVIWWVTWVATNSIHHMWNHICMQFMQLNCNCVKTTIVQFQCNQYATIMQPICNYNCNVMWTLLFIHPPMKNFVDFHCNSLATIGAMKNTLMATTN
jgi:hypothetical protein